MFPQNLTANGLKESWTTLISDESIRQKVFANQRGFNFTDDAYIVLSQVLASFYSEMNSASSFDQVVTVIHKYFKDTPLAQILIKEFNDTYDQMVRSARTQYPANIPDTLLQQLASTFILIGKRNVFVRLLIEIFTDAINGLVDYSKLHGGKLLSRNIDGFWIGRAIIEDPELKPVFGHLLPALPFLHPMFHGNMINVETSVDPIALNQLSLSVRILLENLSICLGQYIARMDTVTVQDTSSMILRQTKQDSYMMKNIQKELNATVIGTILSYARKIKPIGRIGFENISEAILNNPYLVSFPIVDVIRQCV